MAFAQVIYGKLLIDRRNTRQKKETRILYEYMDDAERKGIVDNNPEAILRHEIEMKQFLLCPLRTLYADNL